VKGVLHIQELEGAKFTGEIIFQLPEQEKFELRVEDPTAPIVVIQVVNGSKSWIQENELLKNPTPEELQDLKESAYVDYLTGLTPLLKKDAYQISSLGEVKVRDQAAVGILVKSPGKPDVKLYFDPATALLLKTEYRSHDPMTKKEARAEEFYSAY